MGIWQNVTWYFCPSTWSSIPTIKYTPLTSPISNISYSYMCSTPSCSGCICRRPGTPGTGPSPCSWRGGARPRRTDWSPRLAPSHALTAHMSLSLQMLWVVTGHWSLVSSGAGNVNTQSHRAGHWARRDWLWLHPSYSGPRPRHQLREISWGSSSPGQDTQRREAGGANQRWRRPHRFTVTRIGGADTDIGWPVIGQRWHSSPPIDSLEQTASLLHSQAVDVLGEAERVGSLPQFSPGHRAPPKILHSYWAM